VGLLIRRDHRKEAAPVPQHHAEPYKSLALKALLEQLLGDWRYSVLDLGSAVGANVAFLSQYAGTIRVEDLYRTLAAARFFDHGEETVEESTFERFVSIPHDARFDIILGWDLINYFRRDELAPLIRYIGRFCRPGSFLFAISSTLKEIPATPTNFKIQDAETLIYEPGATRMRPCPRYVPRDLGLLMSGFHVRNSYLLRNGMQEYLFMRD
jgi:SAM-dependent methyltransferase